MQDREKTAAPSPGKRRSRHILSPIYLIPLVLAAYFLAQTMKGEEPEQRISYAELLDRVEAGDVEKARLEPTKIYATLEARNGEPPQKVVANRLPRIDDVDLVQELRDAGVDFEGKSDEDSVLIATALSWIFPLGILFLLWFFLWRRMSERMSGRSGPLNIGKNKAKLYDESQDTSVTFEDIAGIDEAVDEMREVVDFLRSPKKYVDLGAKVPKGVLLVGAPGTGKTLLARAVAGEAKVPFFSLTGSDFVEMFVGVGAARVRDLFRQALSKSPCIVFIDEIDAIGKSRSGATTMATHEEREQTLNQLLSEMDGFDPKAGVVIIAATNRPEVLDKALVRSGRFDRQVIVDRPSREGRRMILEVHSRAVKLADDVDLDFVARRTPGMVGADLAKVVNEAALVAARYSSQVVRQRDFEASVDRIQLGLEKRSRPMTKEETRRVAYHEAGHAVVAMSVEHADPVHRVTIIPRSVGALGATLQLPTDDRHLVLRRELLDRICVMLAGRASEQLAFDDVSTGAEDDLERATETARLMVCRFGMSDAIGPRSLGGRNGSAFLDLPRFGGTSDRSYGDETARLIDEEIDRVLAEQQNRAEALLADRTEALHRVVEILLEEETIDGERLMSVLRKSLPRSTEKAAS